MGLFTLFSKIRRLLFWFGMYKGNKKKKSCWWDSWSTGSLCFGRDQNQNYFVAFQRTDWSTWNSVNWLLQRRSKQGRGLLRKRNRLNLTTLRYIDIRASRSKDTFLYNLSLQKERFARIWLYHSHPPLDLDCPSRALEQVSLSEQQGSGHWVLFWLKCLYCWCLCQPHPSPFLVQSQILKSSRIIIAHDKHRTGRVAWTALMVLRLIKYAFYLGTSSNLRNP